MRRRNAVTASRRNDKAVRSGCQCACRLQRYSVTAHTMPCGSMIEIVGPEACKVVATKNQALAPRPACNASMAAGCASCKRLFTKDPAPRAFARAALGKA